MRILSRILIVCLCCLSYTHTVFAGNCYNITDLAAVGRAKGFIKYGEAWNNLHYVLCGNEQNMCGEGDIVFDNNLRKLRRCSLNNGFETVNLSSIQSCNVDATERKLATYNKCGRVHCADYKIQAYDGKYIVYYKPNGTTTNALQQLCVADSTLYNKLKASCEGSGGTMASYSYGVQSCNCNTSGDREQFRCTTTQNANSSTVAPPASNAEFTAANRDRSTPVDTWVEYDDLEKSKFVEFQFNRYYCKVQSERARAAATLELGNGQYLICGHQGTDGCNNNGVVYLEREKAFYKCNSSGLNKWRKLNKSEVHTHTGRHDNEMFTVYDPNLQVFSIEVVDCYDSKCGIFRPSSDTYAIHYFGFLDHTEVQSICEMSGGTYNRQTGCACDSAKGFRQNGWGACACQTGTYNSTNKTCSSGSNAGGGNGSGGGGSGPVGGGTCDALGKSEKDMNYKNTSYKICHVDGCDGQDIQCTKDANMLTAHATSGHCVAVGRQGYKICTATACEGDYEPYQGYCKKKSPAATPTDKINVTATIKYSNHTPDGKLLAGAKIIVNSDITDTVSDENGKFRLTDVDSNALLGIAFHGCDVEAFYPASDLANEEYKPLWTVCGDCMHSGGRLDDNDECICDDENLQQSDDKKTCVEKSGDLADFTPDAVSIIAVSGFIKDKSNGEPLVRATLAYDATQGVTTDEKGKFEIANIASDTQVSISYVGCTPVTKAASELVDATVELECVTNLGEINIAGLACSHVGEQEATEQFTTSYRICEIDECSNKRDCVDDMLPAHAATGECVSAGREGYKICTPATCANGYTLNTETATCEITTTTPPVDPVKEAEDAYKKAKENEQSLANRALGAASTAATGLGLMTAASAYSEQRADEAAEKDMTAYLETFRCEYGRGQTAKAGNEEITLPGGNDLLTYYTEYKNIADALKATKKALGMRPGIEEEVVYDRAETGLYQYSSVGKTGGAYTSLSRALTDEESEDAAAWAAQKDETAKKLKGGGIAAGAGVAGGVLGNTAINTDTFKNMFNSSEE